MVACASSERRKSPRIELNIDVIVSCNTPSSERYSVRVHDLSLTGMAFYPGALAFTEGDTLCICLADKGDQCSRDHLIEATVVHRYHETVGIRFDSVGILILKDIQRMLHESRLY